jgi:uncharacterized protein involved in outer membrane biogenesis
MPDCAGDARKKEENKKMVSIVCRNQWWTLQKNDDGTFTLTSADGTITVTMSQAQIANLGAIVEAAANA